MTDTERNHAKDLAKDAKEKTNNFPGYIFKVRGPPGNMEIYSIAKERMIRNKPQQKVTTNRIKAMVMNADSLRNKLPAFY